MTGFYMKCNTGLSGLKNGLNNKWVKEFEAISHANSTLVEEHLNFSCPTQVHFLDDVKSFIGALDETGSLLEENRVDLHTT